MSPATAREFSSLVSNFGCKGSVLGAAPLRARFLSGDCVLMSLSGEGFVMLGLKFNMTAELFISKMSLLLGKIAEESSEGPL